ncbi:division/cell wall cluster transcriptional repressor MraZ [candidate division WS6 bacterium RIFOXYD1_FULL_33_8]|uniref:Transcriptional regulator MraZ n=2 Tax=Candidatus Dojkabacteria TaxID=74243 RepID=A0A0G0ADP3_9BACT|nr:MAG: cell division protein MraZ, MraZ protein [candidate division WS6 bacterium GW2011_GWC1_33_20]KKP54718.1 MAG: Protein MraZ [candidate division WS6 bacterium GW2011_GWB1_33_6]KKP56741.1 MAG: Protein MraZ [candidate division WS6 bacterium GW2011_GWF2_33_92]OGC36578.1 MAG: division/cell wall cluster transcriptional repressor MraZ [candidate division WS6 bacterium RIFOXYB1_FULL_33_15]OGC37234.1 MAG: division/cell wall cluster transcriptional repressor MraZ [candidate division WS6 bacterium R
MIIGEYRSKISDKKRVSLPKKFRNELGEEIILTRGYEDSLILVNKGMWEKIAKDVMDGSFINKNIRDTSRFLVGGAKEITIDGQGRFLIPDSLLEHATLSSDVVFIGLINWVELWDREKWEQRLKYLKENGDEIAQEINKMNSKE